MKRSKRRHLQSAIPMAAAIEICEARQLLSGTDIVSIGTQVTVGEVGSVSANLIYKQDAFLAGNKTPISLMISVNLSSGQTGSTHNGPLYVNPIFDPGDFSYWVDDITSGENRVASGTFRQMSTGTADISWLIEGHQYRIFARSLQRWSPPAYFGYMSETTLRPLRDSTTLEGAGLSVILPSASVYRTDSEVISFDALQRVTSYTIRITDRQNSRVVYTFTHDTFSRVSLSDELASVTIPPGSYSAQIRSTIYTATQVDSTNPLFGTTGTTTETDWSAPMNFTIAAPAVQITAGTGGTVDATPVIEWTAVPNASSYGIWISRAGSTAPVYWKAGIKTLQHELSRALPIGEYQLWVRAKLYGGGVSMWGQATTLTIGPRPVVTAMTSQTLNWNPVIGATRYEVWIEYLGRASPATKKVVNRSNLTETSFAIPQNLPAGQYRYWIRAFRDEGTAADRSAWSALHSFTV